MRNNQYQDYEQEDQGSGWGTAAKLGAGAAALAAMTPLGKPLRKNIRQAWEWADKPFGSQINAVVGELGRARSAVGRHLNESAGGAFDAPAATWAASQKARAGALGEKDPTKWGSMAELLTDTGHMVSGLANTGYESLRAIPAALRAPAQRTVEKPWKRGQEFAWTSDNEGRDDAGSRLVERMKRLNDMHGDGGVDAHIAEFLKTDYGKNFVDDKGEGAAILKKLMLNNFETHGPKAMDAALLHDRLLTKYMEQDRAARMAAVGDRLGQTGFNTRDRNPNYKPPTPSPVKGAKPPKEKGKVQQPQPQMADGGTVANLFQKLVKKSDPKMSPEYAGFFNALGDPKERKKQPPKRFVNGGYA